jgi:hypothetical protein
MRVSCGLWRELSNSTVLLLRVWGSATLGLGCWGRSWSVETGSLGGTKPGKKKDGGKQELSHHCKTSKNTRCIGFGKALGGFHILFYVL